MNGKCLVPKCKELTAGQICDKHWRKLPQDLRKQYWSETDYGQKGLSDEFKASLLNALEYKELLTSQSNNSKK
jgi:hypothetical protein